MNFTPPPQDDNVEIQPSSPTKAERFEPATADDSFALSPATMRLLDESREAGDPKTPPRGHTESSDVLRENAADEEAESGDAEEDEERRRREEEESLALARALMAEEAMAVSYHMSVDYLRHNRDQFSEEDLAALQAAMEEEDVEEEAEEDDGGMSYELMLRLGEQLGDVKSERWSRIAQEKISELPTFQFEPDAVKDKDENDSEVKCLVCQFAYEKDESLRRLRCGHCFHRDCIDQWLQSKDFCCYCRTPIIEEDNSAN